MPVIEQFDETLDINSTTNYSLVLQLSKDELSYSVMDLLRSKFIMLRSYEPDDNRVFSLEQIKEILLSDSFLSRRYKSVRIVLPSSKFTLVPAPLYEPEKRDEFFKLSHVLDNEEAVVINRLVCPDAYLLYSVDKQYNEMVETLTPDIPSCHIIKPLIYNVLINAKKNRGCCFHLHVEKNFFIVIVMNNDILKFCNSFTYKSYQDIVYYVMNIYNTLNIKRDEPINCSGRISMQDKLFECLSQYVDSVRIVVPAGNFSFSYVFHDFNLCRYINLFSTVSCE